jgi:hypothetical protein
VHRHLFQYVYKFEKYQHEVHRIQKQLAAPRIIALATVDATSECAR